MQVPPSSSCSLPAGAGRRKLFCHYCRWPNLEPHAVIPHSPWLERGQKQLCPVPPQGYLGTAAAVSVCVFVCVCAGGRGGEEGGNPIASLLICCSIHSSLVTSPTWGLQPHLAPIPPCLRGGVLHPTLVNAGLPTSVDEFILQFPIQVCFSSSVV